jgi:Putative transposase of IS4/5 family (DUF4096)
MQCAIDQSVQGSLSPAPGAICRVYRVNCTAEVRGRPRRYPSDLRQGEWVLIAPLLPAPAVGEPDGGRLEASCRRTIIDAIFYLVDNGCKWRALPIDFGCSSDRVSCASSTGRVLQSLV